MGALVAGEEDRILVYKKNSAPQPPVGHMSSTVRFWFLVLVTCDSLLVHGTWKHSDLKPL